MRPFAFIVSKPLQLLMALSIIGQLRVEQQAHLVVVDAFANAKGVYDNLRSIDWAFSDVEVHFAGSMAGAYAFIRRQDEVGTLFLDGDVGLRRHLSLARMKLARPALKIFIYEEGIGTYRTDLYAGWKARLFPLLGIATHFGGGGLTEGIYVCDPDGYKRAFPKFQKAIVRIDQGPIETIDAFFANMEYVFDYTPITRKSQKLCNVYITSWNIDEQFISRFINFYGDNYLKFHPNIKSGRKYSETTTINTTIPVEMFLLDAQKNYFDINVYHHGSSASHYFKNRPINFKLAH